MSIDRLDSGEYSNPCERREAFRADIPSNMESNDLSRLVQRAHDEAEDQVLRDQEGIVRHSLERDIRGPESSEANAQLRELVLPTRESKVRPYASDRS